MPASEQAVRSPRKKKTGKRSLSGKLTNQILKLVRRIHLYSGLAMFPWVILYGFTALLFNRPTAFPDAEIIPIEAASEEVGDSLPVRFGNEIAAALNEHERQRIADNDETASPRQFRLVNPESASFVSKASWSLEVDDHPVVVVSNLNNRSGYVRISDPRPE